MIPRDPDAPLDMLVVPSGLSGMRALWNVALEAQDDVVVDQATKLLNRTHEVQRLRHRTVYYCIPGIVYRIPGTVNSTGPTLLPGYYYTVVYCFVNPTQRNTLYFSIKYQGYKYG